MHSNWFHVIRQNLVPIDQQVLCNNFKEQFIIPAHMLQKNWEYNSISTDQCEATVNLSSEHTILLHLITVIPSDYNITTGLFVFYL